MQPIVDKAIADLSARLNVAASEITTVSAKTVTWPDSSLGCPQPGRNYLQVLVDGAQVELMANAKRYDYHSGSDGQPALCEQTFTGTAIPGEPPTTG